MIIADHNPYFMSRDNLGFDGPKLPQLPSNGAKGTVELFGLCLMKPDNLYLQKLYIAAFSPSPLIHLFDVTGVATTKQRQIGVWQVIGQWFAPPPQSEKVMGSIPDTGLTSQYFPHSL